MPKVVRVDVVGGSHEVIDKYLSEINVSGHSVEAICYIVVFCVLHHALFKPVCRES